MPRCSAFTTARGGVQLAPDKSDPFDTSNFPSAVTSGALPTGLDLNTNTGVISGTPSSVGTNTFTVTATDANGCTGSSNYTVTIASPANSIGPVTLSSAGFATNGDFQFTISSSTNTDFGIQASTSLADWTLIGSGTTDTNGMLFFQD